MLGFLYRGMDSNFQSNFCNKGNHNGTFQCSHPMPAVRHETIAQNGNVVYDVVDSYQSLLEKVMK